MLLVIFACALSVYASVDIVQSNLGKTCVYVEGSDDTINKFKNFFSDDGIKPFGHISYCVQKTSENAIEHISKCGCFSNFTSEIIVFTDDSGSELASLIGNENLCVQIPASTIHRLPFDGTNEYFLYGKNKKICYINENLLGIGCDSTQHTTFYDISDTSYNIFDIPELTFNGFYVYSTDTDTYYCQRKDSNPSHTITWFTTTDPPGDQISLTRSWSSFWKKVSDVLSFCAKVLEMFVQSGILRRV
ncbi:VP7 [Rotavirus L]|nr:VP7 [Rotavirus L]